MNLWNESIYHINDCPHPMEDCCRARAYSCHYSMCFFDKITHRLNLSLAADSLKSGLILNLSENVKQFFALMQLYRWI